MAREPARAAADESALTDALRELLCGSAHRIWQAGLGAFAQAQREGSDLFDRLAQDGLALHQATQRQAGGSLDKLEKVFEDRVARSLHSLGVPSRQELAALHAEIAQLRLSLLESNARAQEQIDGLARGLSELQAARPAPRRAAKAEPATRAPAKRAAKRS